VGWAVAIVVLVGCGSGGSTVDAKVADSRGDAPPQCATMTCGATCCASLAQECMPTACSCPTAIVPTPFSTVIDRMDAVMQAPAVLGIGIVDGTDNQLHALVIAFDPVATPVGSDIALPASPFGDPPFVAMGYDVNVAAQTTRSTFFASQGTLNLTRRCAMGVAGTIAGVTMREQTSQNDPTPHPTGCTLAVPDLAFDFGAACP